MKTTHRVSGSVKLRLSCILLPVLALLVLVSSLGARERHAPATKSKRAAVATTGPKIWLADTQSLRVSHVAARPSAQSVTQNLAAGQGQPLSMAKGDFDADGVEDLVVGYATPAGGALALHRGNLDAFAPQSEASFQAIGHGQFPPPFLEQAQVIDVPVRPDFLAVGNFSFGGYPDLVVAAGGDSAIYLLTNDGKGNFSTPKRIAVGGLITTLAVGDFGGYGRYSKLLVGVSDQSGSRVMVYEGALNGIGAAKTAALSAPASNLTLGELGDAGQDAFFISGGSVEILHASSMRVETLSLGVTASALALGSFIFDRNPQQQIAVLGSDGSVHVLAHQEFDSRAYTQSEIDAVARSGRRGHNGPSPLGAVRVVPTKGWKVVENVGGVAASSADQPPVLLRTRISDHGADDVMVLDGNAGQITIIAHPDAPIGATQFVPAAISTRPYNGSPRAALAMRVNVDGRPGVVALHQGQAAPAAMMPLPDPTFFPNRFDDITPRGTSVTCLNTTGVDSSMDCTLREAILKANATAGTDTIMLAAGTYTLSIPRQQNNSTSPPTVDYSGQHGALYVNDSLNIVGAGQNTTIIQAGTNATNGVDMVMAVNEDINPLTNATASISNLTLQFGRNTGSDFAAGGSAATQDGDGGCMEFDTGTSGNASLTLTNVTLQHCSTTNGNAGGIVLFNFLVPAGTGTATISNSIIQNNAPSIALAGAGGGFAGGIGNTVTGNIAARLVLTNSQVINNQASLTASAPGTGGGMVIFGPSMDSAATSNGSGRPAIHNSIISGNQAGGEGGGILCLAGVVIDQGTVISNNIAGAGNQLNNVDGGGIYMDLSNNNGTGNSGVPDVTNITNVTFTGNSAPNGDGGAIRVDDAGGSVNISFSRFAGNTAGGVGSNLSVRHDVNSDPGSKVTATNNWWGTNAASTTIDGVSNCPTPGVKQVCFDPFVVLSNTANPATVAVSGTSTVTASFLQDNHGTPILAGNLSVLVNVPITFNDTTPSFGSLSNVQTTIQTSGTATATFTASTGFPGPQPQVHINATVDNATVTADISIPLPPSIAKAFNPTTIALNGTTSLQFTLTNPAANAVALTGVGFTDTLPTGLTVASGTSTVCGGTLTTTAPTGIVLSGATIAAAGTCQFSVTVTGATAGSFINTTGTVTSNEGGAGNTATATLTVVAPPSIAKAFNPSTIAPNATTSLTFTITNPAANTVALAGVAFTDTLPTGLTVASSTSTVCGGTLTTTAPTGISLTGATIATSGTCQFSVTVTGAAAGQFTNTTGAVSSTNGGTGNTATANLTVIAPPSIVKSFNPNTIAQNATTSLQFTITNPTTNAVALAGVAFADTLPTGLTVASSTATVCGGTLTTANPTGISLAGATVAASGQCQFSVTVTAAASGQFTNTTGAVTSTNGGTGNTASASLSVIAPPSIIKAFGATSIPLNGTTSLTFTIANPNTTATLTGIGFTDTLPTGLTVASGTSTVCGGTLTTTAPTAISLTGATIAAAGTCPFSVTVTGATAGSFTNTTGAVSSTNGGTGNTASANLTVVGPPSIAKAFNPTAIAPNATTSLTFTITNPAANTVALAGVAFTDTLPTGLTVASGTSTVCGGTLVTTNPTAISLTGATVAVNSQCQFSVTVTGTTPGQFTNTTGAVSSTNGGTGNTATANLSVGNPPTVTKTFGATTIPVNGTTSLTISITNPNSATAITGLAFTDTFPAGLVVAATPNLANTCGGTASAPAGATSASLTAGTLAAGASCAVSLNVTSGTPAVETNVVSVTSTNSGNSTPASATLAVVAPAILIKSFGAATIPLGGSTSLSFTLQNSNLTQSLANVGFTDTLPTGLVVASPNSLTGSCGGGTITAGAGASAISLSGATLATSTSCTFSVNVTGVAAGLQNNTTGAVSSGVAGTGGTASANITVVAPPSIVKSFNPTAIAPNATTSLTFTITNPAANTVALAGVAFTDTLPTGLTVASGTSTVCGGTLVTANPTAISLTGATVAVNSQCQFGVTVTGTTPGQFTNTTGAVGSTNGGTGNTATANLTVGAPPTIAKAFGATSIGLGASTSLTFTITNPNSALAFTGVAFTDSLPAGLDVSTPNGLTGTCGSGTVTAVPGSQVVTLAGGTIPGGGSCSFSVNVTGLAAGSQVNTTGNVSAANGGTGNTATASIIVLAPDLTISKSHTGNFFQGQMGATYTITVSNVGQGPTAGTVTVTEVPPAGLTVTSLIGSGWTCTLGTLTCTRTDALAAGSSYPPITATVSVATNAPSTATNTVMVAGGGELNLANDTATDPTTITAPPDFTLTVAPPSETIRAGQTATFNLTITPVNNAFTSPITISAIGLPPKSQLTISSPTVTLGSNPTTISVVIMTTKGDPFLASNSHRGRTPFYAMLLPLSGLLLSGIGFRKRAWRKDKGGWVLLMFLLICCGVALNGCASASNFKNLGTTPGTYSVSIAATSGATQHAAPATLIVQP